MPSNHRFDVRVDDDALMMSFADYPTDDEAIVERIEGRREPETVSLIRALVRPGASVVELGGCYGYFTLIMSQCAGPTGRVLSVEGTPNNFQILTNNLRQNNAVNVETINAFVTSKASVVTFDKEDRSPYGAIDRLDKSESLSEGQGVPAIRLSEELTGRGICPDVIFMDIESFELDVIDDLSEGFFDGCRPTLVFELHPRMYAPGRDVRYIVDTLASAGYVCRRSGRNMIALSNEEYASVGNTERPVVGV